MKKVRDVYRNIIVVREGLRDVKSEKESHKDMKIVRDVNRNIIVVREGHTDKKIEKEGHGDPKRNL
jgi:hypothetical protein